MTTSASSEWVRERLQHLQMLSAALASARTEREAIDATLDRGLEVFEADQAVICVLDDTGRRFRIAATRGYPGSVESDWSSFPNSEDFPIAQAVTRQEAIVVLGPEELVRRYPKLAGTERSSTLICLPMGAHGGIALGYEDPFEPSSQDIEFMAALARQCGEAIRRAQLDAERGRRAQRLALLAEAGAALGRTLDYRTTLGEVANLAVPRLADCCIVDIVEPGGVHQLAAVHVRPEVVAEVARLEEAYPADPDEPRSAVGEVLRTGVPTLVPELDDSFLDRITRGAEHRSAIRELGMRSVIIVPLVARGRTLGAITLIVDASDRRYDEQDLATAQGLADRAALAIDNARLHQAQIEIAHTLQKELLPAQLPAIPGVDLAARYVAAGEGMEVGGDFYDVWRIDDDSFGVAIGDVSGKGAVAAGLTALARHTVRVASLHEPTPSRVLRVLNDEVRRREPVRMFCTALYAHAVRRGDGSLAVTLACGGHPPGVVVRASGAVEEAGRPGMLLGIRPWAELSDVRFELAPGEVLVLFTDGVTERRNDGRLFGEERLTRLLRESASAGSADELATMILDGVVGFAPEAPQDDVAFVVVRCASA